MIFTKDRQFHVAWSGGGAPGSGYGASGVALMKAMEKCGIHVYTSYDDVTFKKCEVGICYSPAGYGMLEAMSSPYKILYTMFEADRWPDHWVMAANCANQVWVPTNFCADSLRDSGCSTPIEVIPLGVDPEVFYPADRTRTEDIPYTFGFAGVGSLRKGFDVAVDAFLKEFSPKENVRFLIRSSSILSSSKPKDKRVTVSEGYISEEGLRDWYNSVDCFVLPSHGEGFGCTPVEAMACGCCTAVTAWGGSLDYMGDHTLGIAIERLESCEGYHGCNGKWAKPSFTAIRYVMRWAHDNQQKAAEMGMKAATYVKDNWTFDLAAKRIKENLTRIDPHERVSLDTETVAVWKGNPRKVSTRLGGFTRNVPRPITREEISQLNPSDIGEHGFSIQQRFRRATSGSV